MEKRVCLGRAEEVLYFFKISSLSWCNQNALSVRLQEAKSEQAEVSDGSTLTVSPRFIFFQFRCCGVSNYTDWFEVYNTTRVPDSCCLEFSENCGLHSPGTWWKAVSSSAAHGSSCLAAQVKGRQVGICRAALMISCAPHSSILIHFSSGAFRRLLFSLAFDFQWNPLFSYFYELVSFQ